MGDLHHPLRKSVALDDMLCIKRVRTVNVRYLIRLRGRMFVLDKRSLTLRRQKVTVPDRFDGRLSLRFKGRELKYKDVWEPRSHEPKPVLAKPRHKPPHKYKPLPPTPGGVWSLGTVPIERIGHFHIAKDRTLSRCLDSGNVSLDKTRPRTGL